MEDLLGSNPTGSALLHACADPVKTPLLVTQGRRKLVQDTRFDLQKNWQKYIFTWKIATVHQRVHRACVTEAINRTHLLYLKATLNMFVVMLERKKRACLHYDRASRLAQSKLKKSESVGKAAFVV